MDAEQATSETPFLLEKELNDRLETHPIPNAGWFQRNKKYLLSNLTVIAVCAILGAIYDQYLSKSQCYPQSLVYTPARNNLEYVKMRMDTAGNHQSKYMGFSDKADEAWTDLTSRSHVRLSDEDLRAINQTSVPLGSGGYLGMLAVYHELHCVKWIRWALDQAKYSSGISTEDMAELPAHIGALSSLKRNAKEFMLNRTKDHCVDVVRQSIQCRANTAIVTYRWTEETRVPKTNYHAEAECMNWEKLEFWAEQHKVDISEPAELNHPVYGQSYPNGHKVMEKGKVPTILPALEYQVGL